MFKRWLLRMALIMLALSVMALLGGCGGKEEEDPVSLSTSRPSLLYFFTAG